MALKQPNIEPIEKRLEQMLKERAAQRDVDPIRFYSATRPIITRAWVDEYRQLRFDELFDFEEPFRFLSGEEALSLLERYKPKDLESRIRLAHEWSDAKSCFYGLDDWEAILESFLIHQRVNVDVLLETGYPISCYIKSRWIDRLLGCVYPVKYQYDFLESSWRTKKAFGQFGTIGDPTDYRNAAYFDFLDSKSATTFDEPDIRKDILAFREQVFSRLLFYLRKPKEEKLPVEEALKMASDCLIQGNDIMSREKIVFLLDQDLMFDAYRDRLPKVGGTQLPIQPGGFSDVARLVEQVTMEIALRHRSGIRARLYEYSANSPAVGLSFDLKEFYQDYGIHNGHDFEPLYQAWKESIGEQKNYSGQFWQMVESISKSYLNQSTLIMISKNILEKQLILVKDDCSIVFKRRPYKLRENHFRVIEFLADRVIRGVPWVHKEAVYFEVDKISPSSQKMSIFKYFQVSKGNPKKLTEANLILTGDNGMCRLNVSVEDIEIVSSPTIED